MFLIEQFYKKQQCKRGIKKNKEIEDDSDMSMDLNKDGPCGNKDWCTQCSTLALKDKPDLLKSLDEIMLDNFKYIQQITVMIEAPKTCPYAG